MAAVRRATLSSSCRPLLELAANKDANTNAVGGKGGTHAADDFFQTFLNKPTSLSAAGQQMHVQAACRRSNDGLWP